MSRGEQKKSWGVEMVGRGGKYMYIWSGGGQEKGENCEKLQKTFAAFWEVNDSKTILLHNIPSCYVFYGMPKLHF